MIRGAVTRNSDGGQEARDGGAVIIDETRP